MRLCVRGCRLTSCRWLPRAVRNQSKTRDLQYFSAEETVSHNHFAEGNWDTSLERSVEVILLYAHPSLVDAVFVGGKIMKKQRKTCWRELGKDSSESEPTIISWEIRGCCTRVWLRSGCEGFTSHLDGQRYIVNRVQSLPCFPQSNSC